MSSGVQDVANVLVKFQTLNQPIDFSGVALDFGCGVGRLSAALASRFRSVVGVDVSQEMVRQARELTAAFGNIQFVANSDPDLRSIEKESISFILSLIVIQHIPPPYSIHYLQEFARILKPGGVLVVQIPSTRIASFRNSIRALIPEKLFRVKHSITKVNVPYVTMFGISETDVTATFAKAGLTKILIEDDSKGGTDWNSRTYYVKK